MKNINDSFTRTERPIKIVQFGEGNFLRGFVDYIVDVANEQGRFNGDVAMVKARPGSLDKFRKQDNLYTVSLRGIKNGSRHEETRVITCIQKVIESHEKYDEFAELATLDTLEFVVSNTTEAGICYDEADKLTDCPPKTYPAKLTKFLYMRYQHFDGDMSKGLTIFPLELIEENAVVLKKYVNAYIEQWGIEPGFQEWIDNANRFCSTLVDRIVTGNSPSEAEEISKKYGYQDPLLVAAEPFGLWVIEGDESVKKSFDLSDEHLQIKFTDCLKPYRENKVRILNGAHTSFAMAGFLSGKDTVMQCMNDPVICHYITELVRNEILPTVTLPRSEAEEFTKAVFERFKNPYVKHRLLSISLNSVAKWRARVLPTLRDQIQKNGGMPKYLTFSFAAMMAFYRSTDLRDKYLVCRNAGRTYEVHDDMKVLRFFAECSALNTFDYVEAVAANVDFWGEDLTQYMGFVERIVRYLKRIETIGMEEYMETL